MAEGADDASVHALCKKADGILDATKVTSLALEGLRVRVRRSSHQVRFRDRGRCVEEALLRYGASASAVEGLSLSLESGSGHALLDEIDAFVMMAFTTGVSVETIELLHTPSGRGRSMSDKLYVMMPQRFEGGLVRRRLQHARVDLHLVDDQCTDLVDAFTRMVLLMNARLTEDRRMEESRKEEFRPTIGIVTALPVEFEAMSAMLGEPRPRRELLDGVFRDELHGTIAGHDGEPHHVVVVLSGAGNNQSALATQLLLQRYDLAGIFMVGIAGGVPGDKPETDVRLGDVVICNRQGVVQYDMIKQRPTKADPNHPPRAPSENWLRLSMAVMNDPVQIEHFRDLLQRKTKERRGFARPKRETDKLFDDRVRGSPVELQRIRNPARKAGKSLVLNGVIGSANRVVKSQRHRDNVRKGSGALAVEMEGSGVADAAQLNATPYFVVRGICDYANTSKNDQWHAYAAMAAAAFTATLLSNMPVRSKRP